VIAFGRSSGSCPAELSIGSDFDFTYIIDYPGFPFIAFTPITLLSKSLANF